MSGEFDQVRIVFDDGSNTVINVLCEDHIQDAIIDLCDNEGYDPDTVTNFYLED